MVRQFAFAVVLVAFSCSVVFGADPSPAEYLVRGDESAKEGDVVKAIGDYTEALRLDPNFARAYAHRGEAWLSKGELDNAIKDYANAIRIDPKLAVAYNNLAWLQATCPDKRYRDGKKAVANAKQACKLTAWKNEDCFDTLAAAYAQAGDFQQAIKCQEKAIALATKDSEMQNMRNHLELYKAGKPFRDAPKK